MLALNGYKSKAYLKNVAKGIEKENLLLTHYSFLAGSRGG